MKPSFAFAIVVVLNALTTALAVKTESYAMASFFALIAILFACVSGGAYAKEEEP